MNIHSHVFNTYSVNEDNDNMHSNLSFGVICVALTSNSWFVLSNVIF